MCRYYCRFIARSLAVALVGSAGLIFSTSASAQDAVLEELYGSGVHEFYSGNYPQAIADLTTAATGGSKDPRVYYFRAMANLKMGDARGAEADMEKGSTLESADINQFYPVSKSLERVQGSGRLALERHRVKARAEAHMREERRNAARYEQQRRAESEVLRAAAPAPGPVAPGPSAPAPGAVPPAAVEADPFDEPAAGPPAAGKVAPAEPADDDPFGAGAAPAGDDDAMGGGDDAMGGDDDAPPAKAPAKAAADDDVEFGEDDEPAAAPAKAPAKGKAPAADDDDDGMAPDDSADEEEAMPAKPAAKAPAKAAAKAPAKSAAADEEEDEAMMADDGMDAEDPPAKAPAKAAAKAPAGKAPAMDDEDEDEVMPGPGSKAKGNPFGDDSEDDDAADMPAKGAKPAAKKPAGKMPAGKVADDDDE